MSAPYTPTTADVRGAASRGVGGDGFDRWLIEHDRQVAEAARRDALELLRVWAESDLERAQPKYGEYAEGLRNAQAIVRALIGGTKMVWRVLPGLGRRVMSEDFATSVVEGIILDYINIGLNIADTGTPDRLDTETWERCIYEIRHLHLSEPWHPAMTILSALQLAGWTPPDTAEPSQREHTS